MIIYKHNTENNDALETDWNVVTFKQDDVISSHARSVQIRRVGN